MTCFLDWMESIDFIKYFDWCNEYNKTMVLDTSNISCYIIYVLVVSCAWNIIQEVKGCT